ncbi:MAG: transposase [Gammaproteobacteria bacterium]|nr:transposase [Gammaproteobacteria bacterium]
MKEMSRTTRSYTAEFKREAVQLAINFPSVARAAKDLSVPDCVTPG